MVRNVDSPVDAVQVAVPPQFGQRTAGLLDAPIDEAIAQRAAGVEINMAGVQSLDSHALNWLLTAQTRLTAANITLRIINPNRLVEDILIATRLDVRLNMQPTEAAANARG